MERKHIERESEVIPESHLGLSSQGPARLPDRAYPSAAQQKEKSVLQSDLNRRRPQ